MDSVIFTHHQPFYLAPQSYLPSYLPSYLLLYDICSPVYVGVHIEIAGMCGEITWEITRFSDSTPRLFEPPTPDPELSRGVLGYTFLLGKL